MGVGQPLGCEPHTPSRPFLGPAEGSLYCAIGLQGKGALRASGSHMPPLLSSLAGPGLGAGRKLSQALEAIGKGNCTPRIAAGAGPVAQGLLGAGSPPRWPVPDRGLPISLGRPSPAPAVVGHCLSPGAPPEFRGPAEAGRHSGSCAPTACALWVTGTATGPESDPVRGDRQPPRWWGMEPHGGSPEQGHRPEEQSDHLSWLLVGPEVPHCCCDY